MGSCTGVRALQPQVNVECSGVVVVADCLLEHCLRSPIPCRDPLNGEVESNKRRQSPSVRNKGA